MPPLHPAVVHFPLALVTLSVFADVAGYLARTTALLAVGWWALAVGAIGAAVAVVAGLTDMARERIEDVAHHRVHLHMRVGFTLFVVLSALTFWRWLIYLDATRRPGGAYLAAAAAVFGLTIFQGWLGSELVFSYGVGVAPTGQGTEGAAQAKRRVERVLRLTPASHEQAGGEHEGAEHRGHHEH
jgi:uncharacterized membrane protein